MIGFKKYLQGQKSMRGELQGLSHLQPPSLLVLEDTSAFPAAPTQLQVAPQPSL